MFQALKKLLLVGVPLAALTFAPVAANEAEARPRRSVNVWVSPGGFYVGTYPRYYSTWYRPYGYSSYYYYPRSYYYPSYSYGYTYYGYPYSGYYYYR